MSGIELKEASTYVLPRRENGDRFEFQTPEQVADLNELYQRHVAMHGGQRKRAEERELNLLVRINRVKDIEDDVELTAYLADADGEPMSETFQLALKKVDFGKDFSRDFAAWFLVTNIFLEDLEANSLHLVIQAVTVRPSLKSGGKRVAGQKFRQPYSISVLSMPSKELMTMIQSWANGKDGYEVEVDLECVMGTESRFYETAKMLIGGVGDLAKIQSVKGEISVTLSMWYGKPYAPTLPKDANFKKGDNLLHHFVASSGSIAKRKRLGDPANPEGEPLKSPTRSPPYYERKFGPRVLRLISDENGNVSSNILDSPRESKSFRPQFANFSSSDVVSRSSKFGSLRRGPMKKTNSLRAALPPRIFTSSSNIQRPRTQFTLDREALPACETRGPRLDLDFVTVIPRRPLHTVLPMGEYINACFVTVGLVNTEKLNTKSMKKAPKNVLVKVTLREGKSRYVLSGAIAPALGKTMTCQPEFNTLVHYHLNSPVPNERFIVMLPDDVASCHLHIEFFHCSSSKPPEPLGFAFTKLTKSGGVFIPNVEVQLPIFKYSRKSGESGQHTDYLNQSSKKDLTRGTVNITTELCSNVASQNLRIHWFLNYYQADDPVKALSGILDVDDFSHLAPYISTILDTLFTIFADTNKADLHAPALAALVYIFGMESNTTHKLPRSSGNSSALSGSKQGPEAKQPSIITDGRLRRESAFTRNHPDSSNSSYIPVSDIVHFWISTRLKEITKSKGVIAIKQVMLQWRSLLEWSESEEAKDTSSSKWKSVMYALRSCNLLCEVLFKLVPFGTSDEECKASKVLMAIYRVRIQIREELVRIGKAMARLLAAELPFQHTIRKYIIDRGARWLSSLLECFSEDVAVGIMCDFTKAILDIPAKEEATDSQGIALGMHFLQFCNQIEQEGIFTSPGFCKTMLLPILETLHVYLKSKQIEMHIYCIKVLVAILPVLINGMMADDGVSTDTKAAAARKIRRAARESHSSRSTAAGFPSSSSSSSSSISQKRSSAHKGGVAAAPLIYVKGAFQALRQGETHYPKFKGVIDITEDRLVKLAVDLFPGLLRTFKAIRDKEGSHSYLYYFENDRNRLRDVEIKAGLCMVMIGRVLHMHNESSSRFPRFLRGMEGSPSRFLVQLMIAASDLVKRGLYDASWVSLRLCTLKFVQGVMEKSCGWAIEEIGKRRPEGGAAAVEDSILNHNDDLGEALNGFCKHYWRLAVTLLMCSDLQLERLPPRRAAFITEHMGDIREDIINNMRKMQETMGKTWARYHRTLFPPLLKTSIMLSEKSGLIVRQMLFDLIMHLWRLHKSFKPALHITVDVATDLVMKLSQIRQSASIHRLNKDVPWMTLAAVVKMHPLIISIQELFTDKLKQNLKDYMVQEAKALPVTIAALRTEKESSVARSEYSNAQKFHDEILRLEKQMRDQTSGDRKFIESFNSYCSDIAQYFQFLVIAIRIPRTPEYEDDAIDVCVWLIQFLRKIGKKEQCSQVYDMFVEMHLRFQNGTEQGNALLEYADFLPWGGGKEEEKKFGLLYQAHQVFQKENSLAQCVQVCKRLAFAHEMYSLKFMDVAQMLRDEAKYFETLSQKDQISARFYRVMFVGRGIPAHLRGKSYVYRSGSATRLVSVGEFTKQIKDFFPGAKVINTTEPPTLKAVQTALKENIKWHSRQYQEDLKKKENELASGGGDATLLNAKVEKIKKAISDLDASSSLANTEVGGGGEGGGDEKNQEKKLFQKIITSSQHLKLIQITTLTVSNAMELQGKTHHLRHVDATKRHKRYHYENNVEVFMFTRVIRPTSSAVIKYCKEHKCEVPPQGAKRNEYRDLWVERNYVKVQQAMPTVRRRVPVLNITKAIFTPLRNAIVTLRDKNEEIKSAMLQARSSHEPNDLVPLTQNLSGVIDAAVAGGIANYIEAFFDGSYLKSLPQEEHRIAAFKETLEAQLEILSKGLKVFHSKLDQNSKLNPLFQHLQASYSKMVVQLAKGILKKDISVKIKDHF